MRHTNKALCAAMILAISSCKSAAAPNAEQGAERATAPRSAPDQNTPPQRAKMNYPETRRDTTGEMLHGVRVEDPYRWLEDAEDQDVQRWMDRQQAFTSDYLAAQPGREWLKERFSELYYIDAVGTPRRHGDRFFLYRRAAGQEKYVVYVKEGLDGEERQLLDPNTLSEDGSVALGAIYPSPDGSLMAYTLKPNNADEATLYVMDVLSGQTRDVDVIEGAKYAWPSWMPDNSGFYYTWLPTDASIPTMDRPGYAEIRFHELGQDPAKDRVIEPRTGDPQLFLYTQLSRNGERLFLYKQRGWSQVDVFHKRRGKEGAPWEPLAQGLEATFSLEDFGDDLFIVTNWEAPNLRVLKTSLKKPSLELAEVIVPERQDAVLEGVSVVGGKLALNYLERAYNKLYLHDLDGKRSSPIELPGIGAASDVVGEPDKPEAFFVFNSFTIPNQIYQADVRTGRVKLWAKVEVPIDPAPYQVEQVRYPSKDGTEVTMFVVTKKGIERDGTTPFILYGYGGFNASMSPAFRASIYPWLEMGGGYAVANLRGGGEYGEAWHEAGMLANKQNVFDDFHAAAEHLIGQGYTSTPKLAILGGSNGGLLVGAAMTQRPELYGAVICAVPLLDMVRYHLYGSGKTWIPEYGSADDPEQFATLHAYSPYHRVRPGVDYPPTLFMSADSDDRVDPLHARKMVAALQAADPDGEPLLLRIERNAGHGGGDMVKKWVESDVDMYAFLMGQFNMSAP